MRNGIFEICGGKTQMTWRSCSSFLVFCLKKKCISHSIIQNQDIKVAMTLKIFHNKTDSSLIRPSQCVSSCRAITRKGLAIMNGKQCFCSIADDVNLPDIAPVADDSTCIQNTRDTRQVINSLVYDGQSASSKYLYTCVSTNNGWKFEAYNMRMSRYNDKSPACFVLYIFILMTLDHALKWK